MYWKTRICNKWETTGHCPFGDKCHFSHGVAELQKYGGGLLDSENGAISAGLHNDFKQTAPSMKPHTELGVGPQYFVFNTYNYTMGFSNQRSIGNIQELQKYGGGLLDSENGAISAGLRNDFKQIAPSMKPHTESAVGPQYSVFNTDNYTMGISNQRSIGNIQGQRQGQRDFPKWKGSDKISQIYGDWIDDNEWEYTNLSTTLQPEEASQINEEEP
ncbi:hypothetical protein SUGI_0906100 [Cryptomeria japonica]|nr:hypothetical protein SUGI_0906100 [Cryptomeria japonica]